MTTGPIVAHSYSFVVGVDTHARNHVYSIITRTGELVDSRHFPATAAATSRAISWAAKRTGGDQQTLWVVEGAGSYGANLAAQVENSGYRVVEAARMSSKDRHGQGKSDAIDSHRIAAAVLPLPVDQLRHLRERDGIRKSLQILITAREQATSERTRAVNALTALARTIELGIDARRPLTARQIHQIRTWRSRKEPLATSIARTEAIRLAGRIHQLDTELATNKTLISELIDQSPAAELLTKPGIGPITAATILIAWSHPGRIRSEAAFAHLAGTSPIPASSGNTTRHRLNRGGDRQLNKALHTIAIQRMTHDERTRDYVTRKTEQGRTKKEIRRCLKRHIARHLYRTLNTAATTS